MHGRGPQTQGVVGVRWIKERLKKGKGGPSEERRVPGGEAEARAEREVGNFTVHPPLISSPSGFLEPRSASLTCKREAPIKAALPPTGADNDTMGTKPGTQASSGGHTGGFRKVWGP